jgi:integrase
VPNNADGVYTRKDRPGYWITWQDAQGRRRYRRTNAQTLSQARKIRAAELVRVEHSKVLGFAAPGSETFGDLAARFRQYQKPRLTKQTFVREDGIVTQHLEKFFTGKLTSIRRGDIQRYITKRSTDVSAHSIQKEANVLKHMFRMAVEWELIPFSPAQGLKTPKVPAGRVRYLQPGELRLLLESCPTWLVPIIGIAANTGMRRSEILGLRWMDVDLMGGRILLRQTKNGEGRIVYLNQTAKAILSALAEGSSSPTKPIFGAHTPEQISVAFTRTCRKLNIFDFRFHDLRHTAASWLRMAGADIHTVAQLLGHKDLRMAARYQHLSPAFLADAVGKLDQVFGPERYPGVTEQKQLGTGTAAKH